MLAAGRIRDARQQREGSLSLNNWEEDRREEKKKNKENLESFRKPGT